MVNVNITIAPSKSTLVVVIFCVSPLLALSSLALIAKSDFLYGLVLLSLSLFIYTYVASTRVILNADYLELRRFGLKVWGIESAKAITSDGLGGDPPLLPAIIVTDRQTGKKVGEILKPQFKEQDLLALRGALASLRI